MIHECYHIYRANRKTVSLEEYTYLETAPPQSRDPGLYAAIMALREELRLVIVLHYVEGFQVTEIAQMLKIPEGTVKSRLSRARTALRAALEKKEVSAYDA